MEDIYAQIAARTGGNIYIGVVGPVRTGKSTLIKRIMEEMVIPQITDPYRAERARDELPQSGSGKTIMTSEPKFVPEEAVEIQPDGQTCLRVRMIDSVGYMIPGAVGAEENGTPRMVTTPWYDTEIPMTQAAELGTKKVMEGHSSIGIVVTTDGTVTDIPREDYREAERRAIADMQATGKPFLVIVNSREPEQEPARRLVQMLEAEFGVHPMAADCQALDRDGICALLGGILNAFPMTELAVKLPGWVTSLEDGNELKQKLYQALLEKAEQIPDLGHAQQELERLAELEQISDVTVRRVDASTGIVECRICLPDALFYEVLSSRAGLPIRDDAQLLQLLTELTEQARAYEKLSDAIASVEATGYGVVNPRQEEIRLEAPEIVKKGSSYGVRLKAAAPSIHMIRVDVDTQISPMVGDEAQSRELVERLRSQEPEDLWQSNIFGKSVYDLIQDGLNTKLRMTQEVQTKFRGTLGRIVNEGATGLICLIL